MSPRKLLGLVRKPLQAIKHTPRQDNIVETRLSAFLEAESALGSQLFGHIPEGVDRKFFHSTNKNVWIWYEDDTTIRYEVRPHGVFKRVNDQPFAKLAGDELANFRAATRQYLLTLKTHLYTS